MNRRFMPSGMMCAGAAGSSFYGVLAAGRQEVASDGARRAALAMTADQVFIGLGLTLALAVGSQILASRLRIPALIVLLPVGFVAGALTDDINPDRLLGPLFQPLVSLAVAVILFDSGVELTLPNLARDARRVVRRLILIGVPFTLVLVGLLAVPLLGMAKRSAIMLGAILVVSGPTVVGPLLSFVRPTERVRRVLAWEGSLIDPVGGILGAVVFHAVIASGPHPVGYELGQFLASVGVGVAGGVVGTGLLWLLLRKLQLGEVLGTLATVASVVGVAAACDILRDDTGLIAGILMGLAMSNLPAFDVAARRPFFETVIQVIIGVLFVSIAATVTPASLRGLVLPTLGLVAMLVLLARPLVALLATWGSDLGRGERGFVGWMAPRGIVAASTASAFSTTLVAHGIGGANKILPVTFLVIVATVTLYGLSAAPAARLLGVTRPARTRPLLVGGAPWVIELGKVLGDAGLDVLMWAGLERQRDEISRAGIELAPGELLAAATGEGAEVEGVTEVLLLTDEDDFNALAATTLRGNLDGPVYRIAPPRQSHGVVAPYTDDEALFSEALTRVALDTRHDQGATIVSRPATDPVPVGHELLFVVHADGQLKPVTEHSHPTVAAGDTLILLTPARVAGDAAALTSTNVREDPGS
jgi:NhaP-type Na+/H+ or K+/H+ antiporter